MAARVICRLNDQVGAGEGVKRSEGEKGTPLTNNPIVRLIAGIERKDWGRSKRDVRRFQAGCNKRLERQRCSHLG